MANEILYNSPALHALKRHQLVSLSKRHGLKASGKNSEMIDRLKEYAVNLSPSRQMTLPIPAPTPAPLTDFIIHQQTPSSPSTPLEIFTTGFADFSVKKRVSRLSDNWEVLSNSGASLISPAKSGMTKLDSVRSWRSANNGEAMSESGVDKTQTSSMRSKSSLRALASSISRRASLRIKSRSVSASSNLSKMAELGRSPRKQQDEAASEAEEVLGESPFPPSPASTVGIPRRYSRMSLLERPSTIRLCSSIPTTPDASRVIAKSRESDADEELPFFGNGGLTKERRSMAPLRSSTGPSIPLTVAQLGRKSMPAISSAHSSASIPSIYPPLPTVGTAITSNVSIPPVPPIPGAYIQDPPVETKRFNYTVSNDAFAESSKAVLAQMQAKMEARGISANFGEELLKGKKAEVRKLVSVHYGLEQGGWGLRGAPSTSSIADRFKEAHLRDFARMQGIDGSRGPAKAPGAPCETQPPVTPGKRKLSATSQNTPSAPNGHPLVGEGSRAKKRKLSIGPNTLGSIRDAGRSFVTLLGEGKSALSPRSKRRTSNSGLVTRFGMFTRCGAPAQMGSSTLARSTVSRPSTASSLVQSTRPSSTLTSTTVRTFSSCRSHNPSRTPRAKDRGRSTSAQTVASTSSKTPTRPKLPDFGVAAGASADTAQSQASRLSASTSSVTTTWSNNNQFTRKQSQAELIRTARPAPAPPATATTASLSSSMSTSLKSGLPTSTRSNSTTIPAATCSSQTPVLQKRSSTLLRPTASSIARMQATVRPPTGRSLSVIPTPRPLTITQPFGTASSRFGGNIDLNASATATSSILPNPALKPLKSAFEAIPGSPMKTPGKTASSAALRLRHKQSGLSAVKSKGNLRGENEMNAKRADIRAKQARLGEERELRAMLADVGSGNAGDQ